MIKLFYLIHRLDPNNGPESNRIRTPHFPYSKIGALKLYAV